MKTSIQPTTVNVIKNGRSVLALRSSDIRGDAAGGRLIVVTRLEPSDCDLCLFILLVYNTIILMLLMQSLGSSRVTTITRPPAWNNYHPTNSIIFKMLSAYSLLLARRGTLCWPPNLPRSFSQLKKVPSGALRTMGRRRAISLKRLAS